MKNNIRYKGNINNISQWCYFAWENLQWGFCDVGCSCSFNFVLHFVDFVVLHFCCCSSFLFLYFIHCFSTSSLTLPWTIAEFLHPFYTFRPAHHWVIHGTFILTFLRSSFHTFTASATVLSGHFLPTGVFYLTLLPDIFGTTCFYQGFPGSRQLFLEICRASYWSLKHRPGPSVCLIHSNPQSSYSERFSFKFYHILSWIACGESLIYLLLTRFKLFSLVQSHM